MSPMLAGVSSGAAVHGAQAVAAREEAAGQMIVVVLPESAERYVTTRLVMGGDCRAGLSAAADYKRRSTMPKPSSFPGQ